MDNNFEQYTRKYGLEIPEKYVFSKKSDYWEKRFGKNTIAEGL